MEGATERRRRRPLPGGGEEASVSKRHHRFETAEEAELSECTDGSCRSCSANLIADCVAVCCCPCSVVSILALALFKVPWAVGRRWVQMVKKNSKGLPEKKMVTEDEKMEAKGVDQGVHGVIPGREDGDDRVWMELYQLGQWGFGRVSVSSGGA